MDGDEHARVPRHQSQKCLDLIIRIIRGRRETTCEKRKLLEQGLIKTWCTRITLLMCLNKIPPLQGSCLVNCRQKSGMHKATSISDSADVIAFIQAEPLMYLISNKCKDGCGELGQLTSFWYETQSSIQVRRSGLQHYHQYTHLSNRPVAQPRSRLC